jgi:hypothetical protein
VRDRRRQCYGSLADKLTEGSRIDCAGYYVEVPFLSQVKGRRLGEKLGTRAQSRVLQRRKALGACQENDLGVPGEKDSASRVLPDFPPARSAAECAIRPGAAAFRAGGVEHMSTAHHELRYSALLHRVAPLR